MSNDVNTHMVGTHTAIHVTPACISCSHYTGGKPPLPTQTKQRLCEKLFASPLLREKRKRSTMGQNRHPMYPVVPEFLKLSKNACTKKVKVERNGILSPRGKSNKIQPSPLKATSDTQNIPLPVSHSNCPSRLSVLPHSNCPSRLSMTEIALHGNSIMVLERSIPEEEKEKTGNEENTEREIGPKEDSIKTIPETIVDEERIDSTHDSEHSTSSIISTGSNNNNPVQTRYSLRSSVASMPADSPQQEMRGSVPNLRPKYSPFKRVNRSCSHGDVQLKKSFGSGDLLNNAINLKPDSGLPTRHHSVENVTFERRRRKTPTKENGIHNLDGDHVNYYQIKDEIGRGSFGAIYKCHCSKDNQYYAMKIISKKRLMRKNGLVGRQPGRKRNPLEPLHREIAILKKMDHPNIVKLVEVMDDLQVDDVYMVFELMKNGVVIEIPTENTIPEDRSRRLFRELLLGIEYLHYSKIIHRDIKPSNLLLDDNDHIKIADFGVSDMFEGDNDLLNKFAGSPAFQAPEVLNHDSRDKYSGKAVDVWAMGITLFCFLYGKCPFYSETMGGIELVNKIQNDQLQFPEQPTVNPQAQDLISRMLSKDPKERITVLEMKDHPWVTEGGRAILPTTEEHCSVIEVTDEEVRNSVKIISKLSSLVFAKSILKKGRWWKRNSINTPTTAAL